MTLTTTNNRKDYTGNGTTTVFAYDFLIIANADLGVYLDGVKKVLTTDYTVSGAGVPTGGNVTFVVAPGSGVAVSIIREVAYTQGVDYVENQKFPAETHEGALDRLTMLCQQLLEKVGRAATFKIQSLLTNPVMADGVVGKILRWKSTTELENVDIVGSGTISVPVSVAQGRTGGTDAPSARTNLVVAKQLTPQTLTPGVTVAVDASLGDYFTLVPAQSFTLSNPTNPTNGQRIMFRIKQDGTGGRILTLGSAYRLGADISSVVLSTAANKVDYLGCVYDSTDAKWDVVAFVKGY